MSPEDLVRAQAYIVRNNERSAGSVARAIDKFHGSDAYVWGTRFTLFDRD